MTLLRLHPITNNPIPGERQYAAVQPTRQQAADPTFDPLTLRLEDHAQRAFDAHTANFCSYLIAFNAELNRLKPLDDAVSLPALAKYSTPAPP